MTETTDEFAGRVALVTGSSSGIGEQIARRLSALGAHVVVNSSSSVEAGEAVSASLPSDSVYVQADISDQEQGRALLDATVERFGGLDILVNNAGWTTVVPHGDLDALTDDILQRTFDVNVFGTWWLTKAAIPQLRNSADGNIVNITSIAGIRPVGSSMAYGMSKAALNQMTLLLAKSYCPIRVNAVAPGLVATPWTSEWIDLHAGVARVSPVGRVATPDDVAEATLALVRNRYVSGEIMVVDGGFTQVV
jgi:ketoreductase RED2